MSEELKARWEDAARKMKPAHTCSCGMEFYVFKPRVCECGQAIPWTDKDVPFDPKKYQDFKERVEAVGLAEATREIMDRS